MRLRLAPIIAVALLAACAALPAAALAGPAGNEHVTARGDGFQADGTPQPPLAARWTRDDEPLGQAQATPPVAAGGRVFQLRWNAGGFTSRMQALDLATGRVLWQRLVPSLDGHVAASADTVVVTTTGGFQAFDGATGATRWVGGDGAEQRNVPPVVDGDLLLTIASDDAGLVARSLTDGEVLWSEPTARAMPVVAGDLIVISDGCATSALHRSDGHVVWGPVAGTPSCPVAAPVAIHDGRVVVAHELRFPGVTRLQVLDLADGSELGNPAVALEPILNAANADARRPALAGDVAYSVETSGVTARELPSGALLWTAPVDAPRHRLLVTGDTVYVPRLNGIAALDRATGAVVWSAADPAAQTPDLALASDGVVLTASRNGLTAWAPGDPGPGLPAVAPGGPAPAPPIATSEARTLGQSPARDGVLPAPGDLAAPLARRWQRDPGGTVVYGAVTDEDVAIVLRRGASPLRRFVLEAFDVDTGATRWSRSVGAELALHGTIATGDGIVVAKLYFNVLQAFDARTGASLWRRPLSTSTDSMIVVGDRVVTIQAFPRRLRAFDLRSGDPLWQQEHELALPQALSSDGESVYAGSQCGRVAAFALADGAPRWNRPAATFLCAVPTPMREPAPVAHGDEVLSDEGAVRRASDGAVIDRGAGAGRVAAAGARRVGVHDDRLLATDSRGRLQWSTSGAREYHDRPIVAGASVFAGGLPGDVLAHDLADGELRSADSAFESPPMLTARSGTLLGAAGRQVVAYGAAGPGPVVRLTSIASPTRERRPTLSWDVDGALLTTCSVDGAPPAPCSPGFTPPADLADGDHTLTVTATGLGGTTAARTHVRVDTTPPRTTIVRAPREFENRTNSAEFTLGVDEPGVRIECTVDGQLRDQDCADEPSFHTTDGPHSASFRAIDEAGNVEAEPAEHRWTLDQRRPVVTITQAPAARSNVATPTVAFTVDEAAVRVGCSASGPDWGGISVPCTGSPVAIGPISDGQRTVRIEAHDRAGNFGVATASLVVDTVASATTIGAGPPAVTNAAEAELRFAAADAGEQLECRLDGAAFAPCSSPLTVPTGADGSHAFSVRAIDDLGNRGPSAERTWRTDRTPPVLTVPDRPREFTQLRTAVFTLQLSEAATLTCTLDGVERTGEGACRELTGLQDGEHTIAWALVDAAGNAGTVPPPYTWTVDNDPPGVAFATAPPARSRARSATFALSSDEDGVTYDCSILGPPLTLPSPCPQPLVLDDLPDGTHLLTVRAEDRARNASPALQRAFTVDTVGPAIEAASATRLQGDLAEVAFRPREPDAVAFACALAGRPASACAPPAVVLRGVPAGPQRLAIVATDDVGNAGPQHVLTWTQPPHATAPPPPRPRPRAPAVLLPRAARDRLLADVRAAVRRFARRGARLATARRLALSSTLPLAGALTATLRAGERRVAAGTIRLTGGRFTVRIATTAQGRRLLRATRAPLELRARFTPAGGRATTVRASARLRR